MKRMNASVSFTCPVCHTNFEFDAVGECEFVPCPVCGADYVTIKKGKKLLLENFEPNLMCETPAILA